jgi:N-acetylmuramoyl-L-alanine amidase
MERLAYDLQKKVANIKRLKPATQKKLIKKYSEDMGIPEEYFQFILNNDMDSLMHEFNNMKNSSEAKQLGLDKINLNNVNQNTLNNLTKLASNLNTQNNDSDSTEDDASDEEEDPIKAKVSRLREGDMRQNISKYLVENKLFSKTERMVVLLDPVLKELLNVDVNKLELKELNKLY